MHGDAAQLDSNSVFHKVAVLENNPFLQLPATKGQKSNHYSAERRNLQAEDEYYGAAGHRKQMRRDLTQIGRTKIRRGQ